MPKPLQTPDRLFDRTWRPGHPFRPRLSRSRRFGMVMLFLILCGLIGGYRYITNADRVRRQAEEYLSHLTGGTVQVGGATLSIFEGLRLDDVRVYVDPAKTPESLIFTASTFVIKNRPSALLQGKIEASQLIAEDPHVRLAENVETRKWNYTQLAPPPSQTPTRTQIPRGIPEILLRNAILDYFEAGKDKPIGSVAIDGQLEPDAAGDRYVFKLQSRGASQQLGPRAEGSLGISSGDLSVSLWNLGFDSDLQAMLPAQVRNWWKQHGLAGQVQQTDLWTNLSNPARPFKATIKVNDVALTVQPEELLSHDEMARREGASEGFELLRVAGLNGHGYVDYLSDLIAAAPIRMDDVDGVFTFDQNGIDINELRATVEKNRFLIKGHYDGYNPDAPASLTLTNADNQPVTIPAQAQFINSLPAEVREAYTRFRPQGTCTVAVNYVRPAHGEKPQVTGEVNVLDGAFTFERFPYPLRKATGKIMVNRDATTGQEGLKIDAVKGRGAPGGPNENATIEIDGQIGPFGPEAGVTVVVKGHGISSDPALMAAFPPKTRQALKFFDSPGKGEFPKFKGNFTCTIIRFPELESHWSVETRIHLDEAIGSLVAFPYPMDHVTGDLTVNDDHILIKQVTMKRGDTDLLVKGRVDWGSSSTTQPSGNSSGSSSGGATKDSSLRPSLTIVAHNVPIDQNLIHALPPMQGRWLTRAGATGKFDLDGKLSAGASDRARDLNFNFDVNMHDCSLWPHGKGEYVISKLNGLLKLGPEKLQLTNVTAKRGDADITAHGEVDWPTSPAQISIVAEAKNLALDAPLYQMLPESAQKGWAQVQPVGSVDAKLTYNGTADEDRVSGVGSRGSGEISSVIGTPPTGSLPKPDTRTPKPDSFQVTLIPRTLSITPRTVPYRLDNLTGSATITPTQVKIDNLHGFHGGAEVSVSGVGSTDPNGAWDFQLSGQKMWMDEDFKKAIPAGLQALVQSSQMQGTVGFQFDKLKVWTEPAVATQPVAVDPSLPPSQTPSPKTDLTNVDFDVKLNVADTSLDAGVPLSKVNGNSQFTGAIRLGKLTDLSGKLDVASLQVAGRSATNFRADLAKRQGQDVMKLANIQANLAGGQVGGQIDWAYPDNAPMRYAMALVLHNADVRAIAGDSMPDATGQLSASLSMEGTSGKESSRRGGGDVALAGQQLYKIPLMLGLFQVTSLSLPITSPFNEGSCKYTIDGSRVTFDTIELRAQGMNMSGNGHLDFDTGRVGMTFVTENTTWPKLPVIGDVIQGARDELLQIHVRGTIQEPKVSATSLNTLSTTVDEVLKGGSPPPDLPPVKKRTPTAQKQQQQQQK